MNIKRVCGIIGAAIGAYLIFYAIQSQHKINQAKGFVSDFKDFFSHNPMWNPIVTFFGGKAQEKVAEYSTKVTVCLVVGIVLLVAGLVVAIFSSRRKRK